MAKYSKKEFAELCKFGTNRLSVEISRRKVVVDADGTIDSANDKNKLFLEKIYGRMDLVPGKGGAIQLPPANAVAPAGNVIPLPPSATGNKKELTDEELKDALAMCGGMTYEQLEKVYKYLQGEKLKSDIAKNNIELQKRRGEVVPVSPIESLVFQFKQHTLTQQKITYQGFLNEIAHKYSITAEDMAYYKGYFIKQLNISVSEASENFKANLEATLKELAIRKRVGEHG